MKMSLNGFIDEELDMMCEGFFDGIEDLLDFPADDEAFGVVDSAAFPASKVEGCRVTTNSEKIKSRDGGISEDWISKFLDDSNFEIDIPSTTFIATSYDEYVDRDRSLFRSFSPVSVLESNNLTSGDNGESSSSSSSPSSNTVSKTPVGPTLIPVPAKARTKRPRRPASTPNAVMLSECDDPLGESFPQATQKKRKTSLAPPSADAEDAMPSRKCFHCGIQKTPQWRAGPMGPRTLCNACGVRYRSGRLYPEYRPAASPTFVPAIHSNSHKKVVEMRNKAGEKNALKNCDLLEYIRRRE